MSRTKSDTKSRLLDVAQDLIQRNGVNGMSFQDLSNQVGIRKASVHYHFGSKAELISTLLKQNIDCFGEKLDIIRDTRSSGKTKLKRYFNLFGEGFKTGQQGKGCLFGMLMAEVQSVNNDCRGYLSQFQSLNVEFIETILMAGKDDGSFRNNINLNNTATLIFSALEGCLLVARCGGGREKLSKTTDQLLKLLAN